MSSTTTVPPTKSETSSSDVATNVVQTAEYTLAVINGQVVTRPTSTIRLNTDGSVTIPS